MEWAREMAARLGRAVNGEKDRIVAEYQALTGKSPATLYRIAARNGFASGRKPREDRGVLKSCLNDEQLQFVSSLVQASAREVKGTILPLSEALQIAHDNGVIAPGQISLPRLQAILREREMNSTALNAVAPSIRMASLHPNHVHVFDASICIQYYLKNGKGLGFMDERDFREKKPANFGKLKTRLYRLVLADHFSHHLFVRYYDATGENARQTFDFLSQAWRGGHHEKLPFRGVPKYLLMDAGAANVAKGILALLERLGIELPKSMPHNPRRQGSAECAQNIIETHFEARLRFEPATTVEELNANVDDWLAWWNSTRVHRRHGMTRTACWLTIRAEQLRDLPADEILRDLYAEPEVERTVRQDNTITFRGEEYRVKHIEGIRPGRKVQVVLRPYHWPEVAVIYGEREYLVQPIGTLAGGFSATAQVIGEGYKAQPETPVQQVRKANENLAYGEERGKDALPFGGTLRVFGHHAEMVAAVPMPRRGTPMEVARNEAAQEITIMEFLKRLRDAGVTIGADLNRELRAEFGTSVEVRRADEVIRSLAAGEEWRQRSEALRAEG
jgi:transposase InsO family protein